MTEGRSQRICAVRLPGTSRARFVDALNLQVSLGDWVVVESPAGEEAGRVVVAPDQWLAPVEMDDALPAVRLLREDEYQALAERIDRAIDNIDHTADVLRQHAPGTFLSGLRYTLAGDTAVVAYAGERIGAPDRVAGELSAVLDVPVFLEQEREDAPERGLHGGGPGRPVEPRPETFRELLEKRFDILRDEAVFAPQGLPRLGSSVETDQGRGRLVAVEIRHWRATVALDSGEEIVVSVDDLKEP